MIRGDQLAACLDYIRSLRSKHDKNRKRASLMALQAMLETQREEFDAAETTLGELLASHPDNPIGLSELAILRSIRDGGRAGVSPLQSALAAIEDDQWPRRVYEALGVVGQALLMEGRIVAARRHLLLQLSCRAEGDDRGLTIMARINRAVEVPLLLKDDPILDQAPEGVSWKPAFDKAVADSGRGLWQQAAERFSTLAAASGDAPEVWRNLASTRGWLGDEEAMVRALRKYSTLDVPLDDAVEAEALAQLLDPTSREDRVDYLATSIQVTDFEGMVAQLSSDKRVTNMPVDNWPTVDEDGTRPRQAVWVLDRTLPDTGDGITLADVPRVLGSVALFGRETDREPRVELVAQRGEESADLEAVLRDMAGDHLGDVEGEPQVVYDQLRVDAILNWSWRLPDDTPPEQRRQLIRQQREHVLFERWTTTPSPLLGNNTPIEAAATAEGKIPTLAAILLLECSSAINSQQIDFDALRVRVGLEPQGPVAPASEASAEETAQQGKPSAVERISVARIHRLDADKLSDQGLLLLLQRATAVTHPLAMRKLGAEVLRREHLKDQVDLAEICGILAELEEDPERALNYISQARQHAEEKEQSSAPWDLAELTLHMREGNASGAQQMLDHIRTEHLNEPGVYAQLMQLLAAAGVIGPDGRPTGPATATPEMATAEAAASPTESKVWTPADEQGGEQKKLWLPD